MPADQCSDCAAAAARLHHGFFNGCRGCTARAAARAPQAHQRRKTGFLDDEYKALLQRFGVTDAEVKAAAHRDAMTKERA